MSELVPELGPEEFDALTASSAGGGGAAGGAEWALVDFWGYGCPPCDLLAPVVEQLAALYQDRLRVAKVNAHDHPELAARFAVTSVPTLILLRGADVIEHVPGLYPISMLRRMLDAHLDGNT